MEKYKKILKQPVNVLYAFSLIGCMFIATLALTNLLDKKIEEIFSKTDVISNGILQHAQAGASLTNGLVSHFKLDETSGNTVTDSAGSNNGTVVGGSPTWASGKIGSGSLNLNGSNQYVDIPNFNVLNGLNSASISFWVKPSVISKPFISKWGTGRLFEVGSNGTSVSVIWRIGGTAGGGVAFSQMTPANTLSTGNWNHVVVVYNNPSSTVYVNGNQVGSVSGAGGTLNTSVSDPLRIGWNNIPGFYSGDVDDVRIYNRAVTSQEVAYLYSLSGNVVSSVTTPTNTQSTVTNTSNTTTVPATTASVSVKPVITTQTIASSVTVNTQNISEGCAGASTKCVPEEYPTIQACANVAEAGDVCLVSAGSYSEQVMTKKNGTSDTNRITFKANGKVVVNGFDIRNSYITIDGFDITGPSTNQQYIGVTKGGDYCKVINNTIHDGVKRVGAINFYSSSSTGGITGNYCLFKGNTISRINYTYLTTDGTGTRFENNIFEEAGGWDLVRAFGQDHVFYRNVFRNSIPATGIGNHPDFIQTFSDNGGRGFNMLFEENWIENLSAITETGYQMGQMNSGGGMNDPKLSPNFHDFTFRRNVFANIGNNWNLGVPGITFENNTFYRTAYTQDGLVSGGSLTRGDSSRMTIVNNAFIGGGVGKDTSGFYSSSGAGLGQEVLRFYVTMESATEANPLTPIASGIMSDLTANGYTDGNGYPTAKAKALNSEGDLYISSAYSIYKSGIYKYLKATIDLDNSIKNTFVANYNFVSGSASSGYLPKRSDGCVSGVNMNFRFCEKNGVNGGDPMLKNANDPDGPDNIPFTIDDGLKPVASSPLCGKGLNGVDIGVYSCDSNKVFATGNSGTGGIIVTPPSNPPTEPPIVVNPPVSTVGIIYVSNSGNDTNTGAQNSPFKTIQKCANTVKAGETCLVSAGIYPEHVETLSGGANGKYVVFKAQGKVTMKGFRIKNPYVRIEGFDITKYDVGLDQGHIAVEPEGDYSQIINNTIRDGIYLSSNNFTFNGANRTITNPSGGFVSAGFVPGVTIYIGSDINNQILNHDNNSAVPYKYETKKVIAVIDTTLTLDPSNTVFSEGPVPATIYVNKAEKNGVWGIIFNSSTSRGQADNCLIQGNTFRNLAGKGIQIAGSNNVIERNIFERMNGWRMISFFGNNNAFRYNIFRDSPRWPGFQLPKPGTVFALGSGSWDMYDTLMTSTGAIDQQVNDNVFEYNFIKDIDEQLASVEEKASVGTALQNKGLYIRNNVFVNVEMSGSFTRPQTILSNNTFYKSARISNQNFVIGKSTHGDPVGSEIKNNAFVDSGVQNGSPTDGGWYSVRGEDGKATPGVLADFNFVAGSSIHNYPSKPSFKNDNLESNGINGGDPRFVNPSNPLGPDGIPFTSDDGLIPSSSSPLCRGGQNGTYIGAYPCSGVSVPNPNQNSDTVAPVISSISISSINESNAVISWSTNEVSDTQIEYGLTSAYGNLTSISSNMTYSHSQTISGLSPNTTYHFRVKSKDASGNTQTSPDQMFITTSAIVNQVDVTAPIITTPSEVIVVPSGSYIAKISIKTDEPSVCKWSNKPGIPYASMLNTFVFSNNVYSAEITNLLIGLNIVYIKCIDVKGNANQNDSIVNISVGSQTPIISDSDSDGISNDIDKCPNTRSHSPVNQKGCPVPRLSKFLSNDISSSDLNSVTDLELRNSLGKVNFKTGNYSLIKSTGESLDIDSNLTISKGLVYLDSANVPELNKPATITLYNITAAKPKIMRDGVVCDKCTIVSYTNNTLVFTVPGFSTYEVIDELAPPVVSNQNNSSNTSSSGSRSGSSRSGSSSSGNISKSVFTRSISFTATGDDVRLLQVFLNNQGFTVSTSGVGSKGNESTYFGPATKAALIRFQLSKGVVGTGILDTQTMSIINSMYSSTNTVSNPTSIPLISVTSGSFTRTLALGSTGDDVRQLQVFLNTKGYLVAVSGVGSKGNESTYFGPATKAALIRYQIANGINPASGLFGPITRSKVNLQK